MEVTLLELDVNLRTPSLHKTNTKSQLQQNLTSMHLSIRAPPQTSYPRIPWARCHPERSAIHYLTFQSFLGGPPPTPVGSVPVPLPRGGSASGTSRSHNQMIDPTDGGGSGKWEPGRPTLSTAPCFTVDLFRSILLPVSHFISSIAAGFDFCPYSHSIDPILLLQNTFTEFHFAVCFWLPRGASK